MSSIAIKRINKEKSNIDKEHIEGFNLLDSESLWIWKGELIGPPDTPYEKGCFPIQVTFDDDDSYNNATMMVKLYGGCFRKSGKVALDSA